VHRIIRIDGQSVTLMGDGNIKGTERCMLCEVKARVTHLIGPDGRPRNLYAPWRRLASHLWLQLRPIRVYILAIYKKIDKEKL
jgi:hypothetical protein